MAVTIWLTDEDADIAGYLRAKIGSRSDTPSIVRSVTNTEAGASSGVQVTRTAGGTALAWITDRLDGTDLSAAAWTWHLWGYESAASANAAFRVQVYPYANGAEGTIALDNNAGTELGTAIRENVATTAVATATTMADGDRVVIKILIDDAGTMGASQTVTMSYNGEYPGAEGDTYLVCPDTLVVTAATPAATITRVRRTIKDTASTNPLLSDAEVTQAIDAAVKTYSRDRPRTAVAVYSADGTSTDYRLPGKWVWGLSSIIDIEHPADQQERVLLDDGDYEVLETTLSGIPRRLLHFPHLTPASGTNNVLVRYTSRHEHTDERDSIPANDFDALVWLAASFCAEYLAGDMAHSARPTITADSVDHQAGEERWGNVARRLRKLYDEHVGAGNESGVAGAGAFVDWDTTAFDGRPWLNRRRR